MTKLHTSFVVRPHKVSLAGDAASMIFVATNILLGLYTQKTCFVVTNTCFVTTEIILVAAPTNDDKSHRKRKGSQM